MDKNPDPDVKAYPGVAGGQAAANDPGTLARRVGNRTSWDPEWRRKTGPSLTGSDGVMRHEELEIDVPNDLETHIIWNADGTPFYEHRDKLSEHKGRGSAKPKPRT